MKDIDGEGKKAKSQKNLSEKKNLNSKTTKVVQKHLKLKIEKKIRRKIRLMQVALKKTKKNS